MSTPREPKTIEVGSGDVIILDKLFGPTIFANLRITVDVKEGWIIERQIDLNWVHWITIPAQLDIDFEDESP